MGAMYDIPAVLPDGKAVMGALVRILSRHPGDTIRAIELRHGRNYAGDASQFPYRNGAVWFTIRYINEQVADALHIDTYKTLGPRRISNDYMQLVASQISSLRRRGAIADWCSVHSIGIFRVADKSKLPKIKIGPADVVTTAPPADLSAGFLAILTLGSKANTYKFALARALLEYCRDPRECTPDGSPSLVIPYDYLAKKFLEYYWHQECHLHIRQNFDADTPPRIIRILRTVFGEKSPGRFEMLDADDIKRAEKMVLHDVFGHARRGTSLVIPRFQKLPSGRRKIEVRMFYDYDDDQKTITLKPAAFEFFKRNNRLLSKAVLVEWTRFLERINPSLPRLVTKIDLPGAGARRQPLAEYRRMFCKYTSHCFYCCSRLEPGYIQVDHLIPWSFVYDDHAWNLVLACQSCNCKKGNSLPHREFQRALVCRNRTYSSDMPKLHLSLEMLDRGRGWEAEIDRHYETCLEYGFGLVGLP